MRGARLHGRVGAHGVKREPAVLALGVGDRPAARSACSTASRSSSVKPLTISTPPRAIRGACSVGRGRRSSAPVRLPRTHVGRRAAPSASSCRGASRRARRGRIERDVGRRRVERVAIVVDGRRRARRRAARPQSPARPIRCRRRRPLRPASGVRCSAARHRRVDSWWPVPKPIDGSITMVSGVGVPSTAVVRRAPRRRRRSQGGVTMTPPDADRGQRGLRALGPRFVVDVDRRSRRTPVPCRRVADSARGHRRAPRRVGKKTRQRRSSPAGRRAR